MISIAESRPTDRTSTGRHRAAGVRLIQNGDFLMIEESPPFAPSRFGMSRVRGWTNWNEQATSSSPALLIGFLHPAVPPPNPARAAIGDIKALSGLTQEEIAPLVGVSRRSLQAWLAGHPISARNEQRLRNLRETITALRLPTPRETRERLLQRRHGDISLYDMLAEGRDAAARALGLTETPTSPAAAAPQAQPLLAQLDRHEDAIDLPATTLDRRFVGRLRR